MPEEEQIKMYRYFSLFHITKTTIFCLISIKDIIATATKD